MGTSGRRTPPGACSPGPERPDRLPRQSKNEQIAVWFQVGNRELSAATPEKSFNSALRSDRRFTKWIDDCIAMAADRFNPGGLVSDRLANEERI